MTCYLQLVPRSVNPAVVFKYSGCKGDQKCFCAHLCICNLLGNIATDLELEMIMHISSQRFSDASLKPSLVVASFFCIKFLDFLLDGLLCRQKCHQFHEEEKWRTLRKTGPYWAEEYTISQLCCRSCAKVNLFLLAYIILFKHVNFWQYFICLRKIIFNYYNLLL